MIEVDSFPGHSFCLGGEGAVSVTNDNPAFVLRLAAGFDDDVAVEEDEAYGLGDFVFFLGVAFRRVLVLSLPFLSSIGIEFSHQILSKPHQQLIFLQVVCVLHFLVSLQFYTLLLAQLLNLSLFVRHNSLVDLGLLYFVHQAGVGILLVG